MVQAGLCYYASWVRRDLLRMDKYHHTARMLVVSVGCQFLGAALDLGRLHAFLQLLLTDARSQCSPVVRDFLGLREGDPEGRRPRAPSSRPVASTLLRSFSSQSTLDAVSEDNELLAQ